MRAAGRGLRDVLLGAQTGSCSFARGQFQISFSTRLISSALWISQETMGRKWTERSSRLRAWGYADLPYLILILGLNPDLNP